MATAPKMDGGQIRPKANAMARVRDMKRRVATKKPGNSKTPALVKQAPKNTRMQSLGAMFKSKGK